jgi:hypothetical protein
MGFIVGKAYPIIKSMADGGNQEAKKLLSGLDGMDQGKVDEMVSSLLGGSGNKPSSFTDVAKSFDGSEKNKKQKQLEIILKVNPAFNETSTWIREEKDILSFDELDLSENAAPDYKVADMENAKKTRKVKVYSSKPIENGNFVTPSLLEAKSYAGKSKVYEKIVDVEDVAWIDAIEGQYAKV